MEVPRPLGLLPLPHGPPHGHMIPGYHGKITPGAIHGMLPLHLKERGLGIPGGVGTHHVLGFDALAAIHHPYGYGPFDPRRKSTTRESTQTLKAWLCEHKKNPYPTKGEKIMLAIITKMTLTQVSTWFANARRRLKKEKKSPGTTGFEDEDDGDEDADGSGMGVGDDDEEDVDGERRCDYIEDRHIDSSAVLEDDDIDVEGDDINDTCSDLGQLNNDLELQISRDSAVPRLSTISPLTPNQSIPTTTSTHTSSSLVMSSAPSSSPSPSQSPTKPKIWSLADLATGSDTTGSEKSSQDSPPNVRENTVAVASTGVPCHQPLSNGVPRMQFMDPRHIMYNTLQASSPNPYYFPYGLPFSSVERFKTQMFGPFGVCNSEIKMDARDSSDKICVANT